MATSADADKRTLCHGIRKLDGTFDCDWLWCPIGMDDDHWEHCMLRLDDDDPPAADERLHVKP